MIGWYYLNDEVTLPGDFSNGKANINLNVDTCNKKNYLGKMFGDFHIYEYNLSRYNSTKTGFKFKIYNEVTLVDI